MGLSSDLKKYPKSNFLSLSLFFSLSCYMGWDRAISLVASAAILSRNRVQTPSHHLPHFLRERNLVATWKGRRSRGNLLLNFRLDLALQIFSSRPTNSEMRNRSAIMSLMGGGTWKRTESTNREGNHQRSDKNRKKFWICRALSAIIIPELHRNKRKG